MFGSPVAARAFGGVRIISPTPSWRGCADGNIAYDGSGNITVRRMAWIGPTEAAKRLGISTVALRRKLPTLADEGQARRDGARWKIRAEGLEVAYDSVTRSKADSPRRRAAEVEQPAIQIEPPPAGDERGALQDQIQQLRSDAEMPRSEAERQIKVLQRRLLELDLAEREQQLVEVEAMRKVVFERGRRVRDLLMGIPVRIAADLAAEDDPAAVSILLERALVEALGGLSDALQS